MNNFYKKKYRGGGKSELLSAYIDNELSDEEIKKLEEELTFSKEMQDELAELRKVKQLTASSIKPVQENPYFETRLTATLKIKNPWYFRLKKFSPVYGVVVLSLALMVLLKYNPEIINQLLDKQRSNITAFYKENLRPLLYTANLTNEDIFNFAFYHQLPLDAQKKQYLTLGTDKNGKQYFEIKKDGLTQGGNNIQNFAKKFNLNEAQKRQMDSILASYAGSLQAQVLVNEKNTVAINPNIWNFNKALTMDLISFARNVNKNVADKVLPEVNIYIPSPKAVLQISKQVKAAKNNKYIFFTQDSIFSDLYQFNSASFAKEMEKWSAEVNNNFSQFGEQFGKQFKDFNVNVHVADNFAKLKKTPLHRKGFNIYVDSNLCRVDIPEVEIPPVVIPDLGKLTENLENLTRSFSENPNNGKGKNFNYKYLYSDSSKGYKFNYRAYGFDSSFTSGSPHSAQAMKRRFKNFGFNPDSITSVFKMFMGGDSARTPDQKEIQKQLRSFEKQMRQFQKQMEQMQKELKKSTPEDSEKPVEI